MIRIGILSDTHGFVHPGVAEFLSVADEVWHAGDIGTLDVMALFHLPQKVKAVYGNIDNQQIRRIYPEYQVFETEQVKVVMTHIGGYPGRYVPAMKSLIAKEMPGLVVCGHSHILKVMYDQNFNHLHINPGSAGKYGIHKSITAIRLKIDGKNMSDLEVVDIPRK